MSYAFPTIHLSSLLRSHSTCQRTDVMPTTYWKQCIALTETVQRARFLARKPIYLLGLALADKDTSTSTHISDDVEA
jgi:hypothetical protein